VTVKEHDTLLPPASLAVHITRFVPAGKVVPLAGAQTIPATAQLSLAVAANVTLLLLHCAESVLLTIFAGHVITGFSVSLIVTVKLREALLPAVSLATQVTVRTPTAKVLPLAGVQVRLAREQLSVAVTTQVTLPFPHCPASAVPVMPLAG